MDNPKTQYFRPLKRRASPRKLAAFDTEGTGEPGKFVCGAVVSDQGRYTFTAGHDLLSYLCSPDLRGYWLFAHNLEYDLAVMTGGDLRPFSCLFTQSRILYAETQDGNGHKWRFCDSTNLFPRQSVADLGRLVGQRKVGLPDRLANHLKAGKPLHVLPKNDQDYITEYCLRDAEIVYLAVSLLQEELLSLGGRLGATIAGCSMDLFRRKYLEHAWPTPHRGINALVREGYYGARTEPYRLGLCKGVNDYDINSLYPSVQRAIKYPYPGDLSVHIAPTSPARMLNRAGFSKVSVDIPDSVAPPLPVRVGSGLFFPTGEVTGVWPHNELAHALEQGVILKNVEWSLIAAHTFNPFTTFIDDLYARRQLHASSGDFRAHTFKLLLNSAYGRYGVRDDDTLTVLMPLPADPDWEKYRGGELRMLGNWPYVLMPTGGERQPAYACVPIAAYTTAQARIRMHAEISRVADNLVYTDTDSLFVQGELPTGSDLGEMKQEHVAIDVWCVAPKEYAVFSGESLVSAHAKGIPEEYRLLFMKTGVARYSRPLKIREAIKSGLAPAQWVETLKKRKRRVPKRAPELDLAPGLEYYPTRPWAHPELLDLVSGLEPVPHLDLTRLAP